MKYINMLQEESNSACYHVKDRIHSVKNILSKEECNLMIGMAESGGFSPSPSIRRRSWSNPSYRCTNQSVFCKR